MKNGNCILKNILAANEVETGTKEKEAAHPKKRTTSPLPERKDAHEII